MSRLVNHPVWLCLLGLAAASPAAIIGTNPPAQPLTSDRVAGLPVAEQPAWKVYLRNSNQQLIADQAQLNAEALEHGFTNFTVPPEGRGVAGIPLQKERDWYAGTEAARLADNIVSYQTPAGGWSKNLDITKHPRAPGERFGHGNASHFAATADFDTPLNVDWNYVGTFDNDATITQLRFLARVITAGNVGPKGKYRAAFMRGLEYIFAAQYPNGGWPQVWPLQGGYHDGVTFNDDAMTNILELLADIADGKPGFAFVPAGTRAKARASLDRGISCVLAAQIGVNGRRTVWCQQYDPLTLKPASARNYEMPSAASSESAEIMLFLMSLPKPSAEVVAAVYAAADWFTSTRILHASYRRNDGDPRLVEDASASPLWSRYYQIGTDRPIFGDRDKTIHDKVEEISLERRRGYGWYRDSGARALEAYADWAKEHPRGGQRPVKASPPAKTAAGSS
jgi:PelA/Pel-15E family pectate lyase